MPTTTYTTIDGQIVSENRAGTQKFYGPDPLGSVVTIYDTTGTVTDTFTYWPYGEIRTSTGSTATPFKFCGTWGYYSDATGRLYVRARFYRDKFARWQTVDPLWPSEQSYGYVAGLPVNFSDPSGQIAPILLLAFGLVLGGGTAIQMDRCSNCRPLSLEEEAQVGACMAWAKKCGIDIFGDIDGFDSCKGDLGDANAVAEGSITGKCTIHLNRKRWRDRWHQLPVDNCTTLIHEALHCKCGYYPGDNCRHQAIEDWAHYLSHNCKKKGKATVPPNICEKIKKCEGPPGW